MPEQHHPQKPADTQRRVVLAEDNALFRDMLTDLLVSRMGAQVTAYTDAEPLVQSLAGRPPDLVVLDVRLPPTQSVEGLRAAVQVREEHPAVPILVLSQHVERYHVRDLARPGLAGFGYLLKERVLGREQFLDQVRRVMAGAIVVDPDVVAELVAERVNVDRLTRLSHREREVLSLMAEGLSNRAICQRLVVSDKTLETHIREVFHRLDLPPDADGHRRVLAVLAFLQRAA